MFQISVTHDDGTKSTVGYMELAFLFHNAPDDYDAFIHALSVMGAVSDNETLDIFDSMNNAERAMFA